MNIVNYFLDWIESNKERDDFRKAWINGKIGDFHWDHKIDIYHADIAYEIYKLSRRVEALETAVK
jgi:hypothetical protein